MFLILEMVDLKVQVDLVAFCTKPNSLLVKPCNKHMFYLLQISTNPRRRVYLFLHLQKNISIAIASLPSILIISLLYKLCNGLLISCSCFHIRICYSKIWVGFFIKQNYGVAMVLYYWWLMFVIFPLLWSSPSHQCAAFGLYCSPPQPPMCGIRVAFIANSNPFIVFSHCLEIRLV